MLKIKINSKEKQEYKDYLASEGVFRAARTFFRQIINILKVYVKLSKEDKAKAYICVYYNLVDIPILTIRWYEI